MLSLARVAAVLVAVGSVANAASVPRATKKCTTIDSGYLNTYIGNTNGHLEALRKNSTHGDITFGAGYGSFFKAQFQSCPGSPNTGEFNDFGRIVIMGDNAPDGTPKCFTIVNPSASTGPWYAKAEPCTSDTKPSLAQTFGYGNDFGNVIFWTNECGAGLAVDNNGNLMLTSDHRVKFDCKTSYESMELLNTTYSTPS